MKNKLENEMTEENRVKFIPKWKLTQKVTMLFMAAILFVILAFGSLGVWGIFNMQKISWDTNHTLGITASEDAAKALEAAAVDQLQNIAVEKAAFIEGKFDTVQNCLKGIAAIAEEIYKHPNKFPDREVLPPIKDSRELSVQLLYGSGLAQATEEQIQECLKLGNIQDLLLQYNAQNNIISSTYLATESGWMIQADYIAYSKFEGDNIRAYNASERQWYQKASEKKSGEIIYTDIIRDIHQGRDCIVSATPIYVNDQLMAVAGIGSYMETIKNAVISTAPGETGYAFIVNERGEIIISAKTEGETGVCQGLRMELSSSKNKELAELADLIQNGNMGTRKMMLDQREVYLAYAPLEELGWSFVVVREVEEIVGPAEEMRKTIHDLSEAASMKQKASSNKIFGFMVTVLMVVTIGVVLLGTLLTQKITKPIQKLTKEVLRIRNQEFPSDSSVKEQISSAVQDEVEELSQAFQGMTCQLRRYIKNLEAVTTEKERIRTEIQVASRLQADMLPETEGIFADRMEFSLSAIMEPAKGVGGDFYDFFFLDEDQLVLVMGDVSGKGVPAALFMVVARTIIRSSITQSVSLAHAVTQINKELCSNNKNSMFVTAWIGIISVSTGRLTYVNAGHCRPLIRHANGNWEYNMDKSGFVLAGMEDAEYRQYELWLCQGDILFLYTDGVTEATNNQEELYGESRLLHSVKQWTGSRAKEMLLHMKQQVDVFQKGREPFDDITMLALFYHGNFYWEKKALLKTEGIDQLAVFMTSIVKERKICSKDSVRLQIIADEILSNVYRCSKAKYIKFGVRSTYDFEQSSQQIILSFIDDGIPYNPLENPEPDKEKIWEKGIEGGFGIYLVKQFAKMTEYEQHDGKNCLTIYMNVEVMQMKEENHNVFS